MGVMKSVSRCSTISLPVLAAPGNRKVVRASKSGKWRAVALFGVHVAIAIHLLQWYMSGMADGRRETLSPVEPSEAMWTLEQGLVNAGFIMFCAAILLTLVFGRWFCGWACHVVALQDLCGWMMKKIGIHPKPWRSRLLLWVPLGLAVYMFVWPTFRRVVLAPWIGEAMTLTDASGASITHYVFPPSLSWLGQPYAWPREGLRSHLIVEDFWAAFPAWYIAIPYLLVIGFAMIYFLGAKGFCTYGCPYGGIFGPVDRLAPIRIRVTDACNQCGHCTAVCTSNVRVAEEVHHYGAVVDPGCMKCLDCVSVCPTNALYVGFGAPAFFTKARTTPAAQQTMKARRQTRYDLSLGEEFACAAVLLMVFHGLRGTTFFDWSIPMLMAAGVGALGAFTFHKLWRMIRDLHVRGPYVQLKRGGRITPPGVVFALLGTAFLAAGAMGFVSQIAQSVGEVKFAQLESAMFDKLSLQEANILREKMLTPSPAYVPDAAIKELALDAARWFGRADAPWRGGLGLNREWDATAKQGFVHLAAGDSTTAEWLMRRVLIQRPTADPLVFDVARLMVMRSAPADEFETFYRAQLAGNTSLHAVRAELGSLLANTNRADAAMKLHEDAVRSDPGDLKLIELSFGAMMGLDHAAKVKQLVELSITARPKAAMAHAWKAAATVFAAGGPGPDGLAGGPVIAEAAPSYEAAKKYLRDDDRETISKLGQLAGWLGKPDEAKAFAQRLQAAR